MTIFLRAGWSLGQVQDRYITHCDGGDHLCGRIAAGLNFNQGSQFAVLGARFENCNVLSHTEWLQIAPDYDKYPTEFQACLPYFLASIVWHYDWINLKNSSGDYVNVDAAHPIRSSRLFTSNLIKALQEKILPPTTSGRCEKTNVTATGIPPWIQISRQLESVQNENVSLKDILAKYHQEMFDSLPNLVVENIKANIEIEGIQQLSRNDFQSMLNNAFDERELRYASQQLETINNQSTNLASNEYFDDRGYKRWNWGGQIGRPVPESWSFPKGIKVKAATDMFITGIASEFIMPFQCFDVTRLARKDQQYYTRVEYIFKKIKINAVEKGIVLNEKQFLNIPLCDWDNIFDDIFDELVALINNDRQQLGKGRNLTRPETISFVTFYDHLKDVGRQRAK